jgi:heat shock protein HslJ
MTKASLLLCLVPAFAACAQPEARPASPSTERYEAHGSEPGWSLTIVGNRLNYAGNYGEKKIVVTAPEPRTTINGHLYTTERLSVHIMHGRCNDGMSGQGFADKVTVIADGETLHGCGGERHAEWDM